MTVRAGVLAAVVLAAGLGCGSSAADTGTTSTEAEPAAGEATAGRLATDAGASTAGGEEPSATPPDGEEPSGDPTAAPPETPATPGATASTGTTPPATGVTVPVATPGGPPPPQIVIQVAHLEEEATALEHYRDLLGRLRADIEPRQNGDPPTACVSGIRDELTVAIRQGYSGSSTASSLRRELDDLCRRYERWAAADPGSRTRIEAFIETVDRIEEWMRDIIQCIDPGPYVFRCENAYGAHEPGDLAQARQTLRVLARVRRELRGVPVARRFPCYSALWDELPRMEWNESVSRAQMPSLARSAKRMCESFGVSPEELAEHVQDMRDRIDRQRASLLQTMRSRAASAAQLRATYDFPEH